MKQAELVKFIVLLVHVSWRDSPKGSFLAVLNEKLFRWLQWDAGLGEGSSMIIRLVFFLEYF